MTLSTYLRTAGPPLDDHELRAHLRGQIKTAPVPAILELLIQRMFEATATTSAEPAALPHADDRVYHAGRAAALEDLFDDLTQLLDPK